MNEAYHRFVAPVPSNSADMAAIVDQIRFGVDDVMRRGGDPKTLRIRGGVEFDISENVTFFNGIITATERR